MVWLCDDGIYYLPGASLPSSNLVLFGSRWHARGRKHCRGKPGRARKRIVVRSVGRVSTRFGEGGGQLIVDELGINSDARESKAPSGRFLRLKKLISDHGMYNICRLPIRGPTKSVERTSYLGRS